MNEIKGCLPKQPLISFFYEDFKSLETFEVLVKNA